MKFYGECPLCHNPVAYYNWGSHIKFCPALEISAEGYAREGDGREWADETWIFYA